MDPRSGGSLCLPSAYPRGCPRSDRELRPHEPTPIERGARHDDARNAQPAVGSDEPLPGRALRAADRGHADGDVPRGMAGLHRARRAEPGGEPRDLGDGRLRDPGRFPVFAGAHAKVWDLGHTVKLDVVADEPRLLDAKPEHIATYEKLVDEALELFGSRPFDHYDFL